MRWTLLLAGFNLGTGIVVLFAVLFFGGVVILAWRSRAGEGVVQKPTQKYDPRTDRSDDVFKPKAMH